jgi:hypothetical protein
VPNLDNFHANAGREETGEGEAVRLASLAPSTTTPTTALPWFDASLAERSPTQARLPASPQAAQFERWLGESQDLNEKLQTLDRVFESLSKASGDVATDDQAQSRLSDRREADRFGRSAQWLDDFGKGIWLLPNAQDIAASDAEKCAADPTFEGWAIGIGFFNALQLSENASSDLAAALTSITASPAHLATSHSAANLVTPSSPLSESDEQQPSSKLSIGTTVAISVITITLMSAYARRTSQAGKHRQVRRTQTEFTRRKIFCHE